MNVGVEADASVNMTCSLCSGAPASTRSDPGRLNTKHDAESIT